MDVGALDLNIDGRGEAEIQHLADDVGGLEIEGGVGKATGQFGPHPAHIIHRRVVACIELDQDFRVIASDIVGGDQGQIVEQRHADHVVDGAKLGRRDDLADFPFDRQHLLFGLLHAQCRGSAIMQLDDAHIGSGEEVGADGEKQGTGQHHQAAEAARTKRRGPAPPPAPRHRHRAGRRMRARSSRTGPRPRLPDGPSGQKEAGNAGTTVKDSK